MTFAPPIRNGHMPQSDLRPANDAAALAEVYQPTSARIGAFMQVYAGGQFWPMDPRPSEMDIRDIAHSLSMQCRYAGHCIRFYSVAEHSVLVARYLRDQGQPPEVALVGLMHDATEAYLVDVPRPVKAFLAGYKEAEARLWAAVAEWAALEKVIPPAVHEADNRILLDERAQNMRPGNYAGGWPEMEPLGIKLEFWTPAQAEAEFLDTFSEMRVAA